MASVLFISSAANPRFRRLLDLSTRAGFRREARLAVIEGEHLLCAWLQHAPQAVAEL